MSDFMQDIITEKVLMVRSKCPMNAWTHESFEFYKKCISCDFMVVKTDQEYKCACAWKEYIAPWISNKMDDHADYIKVFRCYHCNAKITKHSGASMLHIGDVLRCEKCNNPHYYLKSTGNPHYHPIFAVPYNTEIFNGKR